MFDSLILLIHSFYCKFLLYCHFLNPANNKILICPIVNHKIGRHWFFNLVKWIFVHWIRCEIEGLKVFIWTWADSKYTYLPPAPPGFKAFCDNVAWHFSKNLVTKGFFKQSFHALDQEHVSQSEDKRKYLQVTCLELLQSRILNSEYLSPVWHCIAAFYIHWWHRSWVVLGHN